MTINKQALREAAERAASDSWGYDRDEFNDAITPEVVLALLDELEAAEKRMAELEERTVTLPDPFKMAKSSSGLTYYYADEVDAAIQAAGIVVKGE
nr:ead/Ea22-like family protein [Citrobacter freundii]